MNIGIFTDSFTPEINGVVTSLQSFIAEFRRRGHEVFIFAPNKGWRMVESPGLNTRRFRSILVCGKQVRLSFPAMRAKTIAKLNLDIIHIHTPGPLGMAGVRLGKKLRLPLIYTYHTRIERYAQYYLHLPAWLEKGALALVAKKFYNKHNLIIAPSQGIKDELQRYVTSPIFVIPTGVDIKVNQQLAAKFDPQQILDNYQLKPTDKLLITASRLGKEKNLRFIIDAFVKIKAVCPNSKLLIAGGGPEKETLLQYARSVATPKDIIFLGFLKQKELFSLYSVAKVFLFASTTETQGMVILEAMAMGLPTVALTAIGVEDLLIENNGGFLTKNNLDDFAQKTVLLINDKNIWKEKKQEAFQQAQNFSLEKMTDKILSLYHELTSIKNC